MHKSFALLKQRFSFCPYLAAPLNLIRCCLLCALSTSLVNAETLQTDNAELIEKASKSRFSWLPKSELPESLRERVPESCHGVYIESRNLNQQETNEGLPGLENLNLVIEANNASVVDANEATLTGGVRVSQGGRSISAEHMSFKRDIEQAILKGDVTIMQPGMRINGEYAEVSTTKHQATFNDAAFVLMDRKMRGEASSIEQVSKNKLAINDGKVTSCEPGNESWVLEGEQITVDSETNQGTGKNVKLKIGNVPVFYLPYIKFPVGDGRQTGFLFPSISSSDDGGIDIAVPYYWNLAPNYDATLTPRFISGRGTMLELETRYLNRWMRTGLGLAFLPDDGGSQDEDLDRLIEEGQITEFEARPHKGSDRWLAQLRQQGGSPKGFYTRVDYTRVSDEDYFRDMGTSSFSVANQTFLEQSLELGYQFEHWKLASLAQTQQILLLDVEDPYRKLPQIDIDGRYSLGDWVLGLNNRFTQFEHREQRPDIITGKRAMTDYRLRLDKRSQWGFFVPEVGFKSLHYSLDNEAIMADDESLNFNLSTPQASLDTGLVFEHRGGDYLQTLEPRAFYLYRRYTDHSALFNVGGIDNHDVNFDTSERTFSYGQLYRDSRFIGGDRLDDANQVTLGLTSRWDRNSDGANLFELSAGQIFHFSDRQVSLNESADESDTQDSSEFAAELLVNLNNRTQLFTNAIYDRENHLVNRGSAGVYFASENYQRLFNVSYSFLRNPRADSSAGEPSREIDQLDLSFTSPVASQWALMGKFNYDLQNDQELEAFIGFEYDDCCYRFRVLARRWLDSNIAKLVDDQDALYDQGIFLEIHFKGLGGSGAKVNSILNDGIFGYENREKQLHH